MAQADGGGGGGGECVRVYTQVASVKCTFQTHQEQQVQVSLVSTSRLTPDGQGSSPDLKTAPSYSASSA